MTTFSLDELCPSVISTMLADSELTPETDRALRDQYRNLTGTDWPNEAARVQAAFATLNEDDNDLVAHYACDITPEALAIIVRQNIPEGGARMTPTQKAFWAEFGENLGPDWIDGLRHVVGFIKRMDEF